MEKKQPNRKDGLTRREFVREGTATAAGLAVGLGAVESRAAKKTDVKKTRSYNGDMEYRPLGKTGLWVSAVCFGGHWKRIDKMVPGVFKGGGWLSADLNNEGFRKNRRDVISQCIKRGINYIDACTREEVMAYAEALRGRREAMFFGFSWYQEEMRNAKYRTAKALLGTLEKGMTNAKLDYVDLWRPTMHEQSSKHSKAEVDEMMKALEQAKKQGKIRFCGLSSHDRSHIKWMIETYSDVLDAIVTPFTAKSKVRPRDSLFDALRQYNIGSFGIKPFSSNNLFKGDSTPGNPNAENDDRLARITIRYILATGAITAPIPGMINPEQVDNVADAVKERRQLDKAEAKELKQAMDEAWAKLPANYQWLKDWEYV